MKQDRKSLLFTQISAPGIAAASPDALVGDTAESPTLTNHEGRNDFVWVAPSYLLLKGQHRFKRMDYIYDLISGNVHRVDYETGKADQWHHAYSYDADNRITDVYTSTETPLTTTASSATSKTFLEKHYENS